MLPSEFVLFFVWRGIECFFFSMCNVFNVIFYAGFVFLEVDFSHVESTCFLIRINDPSNLYSSFILSVMFCVTYLSKLFSVFDAGYALV